MTSLPLCLYSASLVLMAVVWYDQTHVLLFFLCAAFAVYSLWYVHLVRFGAR